MITKYELHYTEFRLSEDGYDVKTMPTRKYLINVTSQDDLTSRCVKIIAKKHLSEDDGYINEIVESLIADGEWKELAEHWELIKR